VGSDSEAENRGEWTTDVREFFEQLPEFMNSTPGLVRQFSGYPNTSEYLSTTNMGLGSDRKTPNE
jgi:hypothetical protein